MLGDNGQGVNLRGFGREWILGNKREDEGGIARGSGVVENCWREQGRVGRGRISVPRGKAGGDGRSGVFFG